MSRVAGWSAVLASKIEEWRLRPFDWATADCCQFAADMVHALTGVDYRDKFPRYESREQAEAIMTSVGGIVGLVTSVLGEPKSVKRAQRGDVVACDFGDGLAVGICIGAQCCAPGPHGLIFRSTLNAVAAWSV